METVFRLFRDLAQKVFASTELSVQLIVQIVSISNNHQRGALQLFLQQMGEKHHRERFSTALCMPKHAYLAISRNGLNRPPRGFTYGEVLMVSRQYLHRLFVRIIEANEILNNIEQALLVEHAFEHSFVGGMARIRIIAVGAFPIYKTVLVGRDSSDTRIGHVAHHAECIGNEQRGYVLHVIPELQVRVRRINFLPSGTFQLEHD